MQEFYERVFKSTRMICEINQEANQIKFEQHYYSAHSASSSFWTLQSIFFYLLSVVCIAVAGFLRKPVVSGQALKHCTELQLMRLIDSGDRCIDWAMVVAGTVTMWTPNSKEPQIKMLCHGGATRSVAVDATGRLVSPPKWPVLCRVGHIHSLSLVTGCWHHQVE